MVVVKTISELNESETRMLINQLPSFFYITGSSLRKLHANDLDLISIKPLSKALKYFYNSYGKIYNFVISKFSLILKLIIKW